MTRSAKKGMPRRAPGARLVTTRRRIADHLEALRDRSLQVPAGAPGDNTPISDPLEAVQASTILQQEALGREVLTRRLRALRAAQDKVRNGTYGVCEACGGPIPAARLRALPEAVLCVGCAEAAERTSRDEPARRRTPKPGMEEGNR